MFAIIAVNLMLVFHPFEPQTKQEAADCTTSAAQETNMVPAKHSTKLDMYRRAPAPYHLPNLCGQDPPTLTHLVT